MKYLIINNSTPIHTELAKKISDSLLKVGLQNIIYSPKMQKDRIGSINFQKIFQFKSFFITSYYFFSGYNNLVITSPSIYALPISVLAKIFNKRTIYFMHEPNLKRKDFYSFIVNFFNKIIGLISSDIIVLSEYANKEAKNKFKSQKISRINFPSGLPTKSTINKRTKISFVGNLSPNKRVDLFIKISKLCNEKFVIAGSGDYKKLKSEIKQTNITLINKFLSKKEYDKLIQESKLVLLPYEHSTQSAVLFDCYRNGTPVIATDIGSFREFINYGKTGYYFKQDEYVSKTSKIINEIQTDDLIEIRKNCINYFIEKFSDNCFEKKFINLIKL
jgi:glycosyltransferase involved in cell wall biosynthesis